MVNLVFNYEINLLVYNDQVLEYHFQYFSIIISENYIKVGLFHILDCNFLVQDYYHNLIWDFQLDQFYHL